MAQMAQMALMALMAQMAQRELMAQLAQRELMAQLAQPAQLVQLAWDGMRYYSRTETSAQNMVLVYTQTLFYLWAFRCLVHHGQLVNL